MPLRFTNKREPRAVDELSPALLVQLQQVGINYDGEDVPVEERLSHDNDNELSLAGGLVLFDVVDSDSGAVRFNAWFYNGDSGGIYVVDTTEVVAQVCQCGLDKAPEDLDAEFRAALRALSPEEFEGITVSRRELA